MCQPGRLILPLPLTWLLAWSAHAQSDFTTPNPVNDCSRGIVSGGTSCPRQPGCCFGECCGGGCCPMGTMCVNIGKPDEGCCSFNSPNYCGADVPTFVSAGVGHDRCPGDLLTDDRCINRHRLPAVTGPGSKYTATTMTTTGTVRLDLRAAPFTESATTLRETPTVRPKGQGPRLHRREHRPFRAVSAELRQLPPAVSLTRQRRRRIRLRLRPQRLKPFLLQDPSKGRTAASGLSVRTDRSLLLRSLWSFGCFKAGCRGGMC